MPRRTIKELQEAEQKLFDQVWYDRNSMLIESDKQKGKYDAKKWKAGEDAMKIVKKKYKKGELGPWSDYQWGEINGKLSAIRWVLGEEWDMLDT